MKYIYTITPPPSNVCALANDVAEVVAATGGTAFANTVTSERLLEPEEMFNLQRSIEKDARIGVRCVDVSSAEYWATLAAEYPKSSFEELQGMGF